MPLIDSFVYRNSLVEMISRWVVNKPEPWDVLMLKQTVNFNLYAARTWLDAFARSLLLELHGCAPRLTRIQTKGELRDRIAGQPGMTDGRLLELIQQYRRHPENFYRETPIDGSLYTTGAGADARLVGTSRIKGPRRIAEKGARRLVDFIFHGIRARADSLADARAERLGIDRKNLLTSPAEMAEEFRVAENLMISSLKQGSIEDDLMGLSIPDVAGIKLILEEDELDRLRQTLGRIDGCRILEEERHSGAYNALNLRISCRFPINLLRANPPRGKARQTLINRGLDAGTLSREYDEFLAGADDDVGFEVIVSTWPEFVESEIGRSIHEDRVLNQRANSEYSGHLATNVRYFMDYILALCRSPGLPIVDDVPIKLWVKYMPDTIEMILQGLVTGEIPRRSPARLATATGGKSK